MKRIVVLAALALSSCATPATPVSPPAVAVCIPLGNITPAQQTLLADTLAGLSAEQQAALAPMFSDWIAMRDADRACLKGSP